ncbi:hypothetical protein TSUD_289320 [Trifolium subterraneum]|uniref:Peroxidase n=1 Tax=Trifolium subterraneum TaxID=3900 RepID=A0A2Z6NBW4_TRISU|nr:hypothetical protein TSUD_289320 [Trifolium subterraneum]
MERVSARKSSLFFISFILASLVLVSSEKLAKPPIVKGLDWNYYFLSCPRVERIVRKHLEDVFEKDSGVAPGILRLFFHDCFSQAIENIRAIIRAQCPRVVSCADILVIAAREAVRQFGGPDFDVPLGRKDNPKFDIDSPDNLPVPFERTDVQLSDFFEPKNFDATDLVALSGAHTFGRAHCSTLFNRTIDSNPPIDPDFKNQLEATCPEDKQLNTVNLDIRTPTKFDNMYYINLLNHQGVFTSDQDLASNPKTKEIVNRFASNQNEFFNKFANAFVKVSQLDVLTGNQGEVRKSCFAPNSKKSNVASVVEEVVGIAANM